jgi:hypothetical protein
MFVYPTNAVVLSIRVTRGQRDSEYCTYKGHGGDSGDNFPSRIRKADTDDKICRVSTD